MSSRLPADQLSVVVVSYNVAPLLRKCLESLSDADEIVVVDNASWDGSVHLVRDEFPSVRVIALDRNCGFSAAVNIGAGASTAPFILLLNPDAEVFPGAIDAMLRQMKGRPNAAAIGCRQVDEGGDFQLTVGPPPSLLLELVRMVLQRRLDGGDRRLGRGLDRLLSRSRIVPWVSGSCLLVRREAFEAVGGFDERFFLFFEDIDFCLRLRKRGGRIYYIPSITVLHRRGRSAARDPGLAARAYRESQLWFWEKHRGRRIARLVATYQRWRGVAPGGG